MGVNLDKPHLWKADIARSVDLYNQWFLNFAPTAYRRERSMAAKTVKGTAERTNVPVTPTIDELADHSDVRNACRERQLAVLQTWLEAKGYKHATGTTAMQRMKSGTFALRLKIPGLWERGGAVNIPVDAVVMPLTAAAAELPVFVIAIAAGNFTKANKRRKQEATVFAQLRREYGQDIRYFLLLSGYYDGGYLGFMAAEGIDWVWEHRMDDLAAFGI